MAQVGGWGGRLRARARELGLSDSEVARRLGLTQRRYSSYVNETREPNFADFLRICDLLAVTPDVVLGVSARDAETDVERRAVAAIRAMDPEARRIALDALEGIAARCSPPPKRQSRTGG